MGDMVKNASGNLIMTQNSTVAADTAPARTDEFRSYARKCWIVFGAIASATLIMVGVSFMPGGGGRMIGLVLGFAALNACLVAGYLMHLITERKAIYALLAFTVIFFVGLMGLSWWASYDLPAPR